MKIELIEWVDSAGDVTGWGNVSDVHAETHPVESIGYVYKETGDVVLLIPHYAAERTGSYEQCRGEMIIMKCQITKRTELVKRD